MSTDTIKNLLIAVSGGSDSMALMHHLAPLQQKHPVHVATVDHQLRREAKQEAQFVAKAAQSLGLPHTTLTWSPPTKATSENSRVGRYRLLAHHALSLGADTIALGHTLDDQAETLIMRALRQTANSSTKGLASISPWAHYDTIRLWRPLLHEGRQELRKGLRLKQVSWIDDPSNENIHSERVRVRNALMEPSPFPSAHNLSRLAALSSQTRQWLNQRVAAVLRTSVSHQHNTTFAPALAPTLVPPLVFAPCPTLPLPIVVECLLVLIMHQGAQSRPPAPYKITDIAEILLAGQYGKKAVGHCLITVKKGQALIQTEQRGATKAPVAVASANDHETSLPFQFFRHQADDALFNAIEKIAALNKTTASNKE